MAFAEMLHLLQSIEMQEKDAEGFACSIEGFYLVARCFVDDLTIYVILDLRCDVYTVKQPCLIAM